MGISLKNLSKQALIALLQQERQESEAKDLLLRQKEEQEVYLKARIAELERMQFGQKRERFVIADQLLLPFETSPETLQHQQAILQEQITYTRAKHQKKHPGRAKLPEHLPVEVIEIYPDVDLSEMVCIGKEVTQELECIPARYFIKRYIRYKYAPKSGEGAHQIATLPERVINKGIPGAGLLASILVDKYVDHLPLHRQIQRFKREGIRISPSTIGGWVRRCAEKLKILYESMVTDIQNRGYLQVDETGIKVLDSKKKGATHQGYFWVYHDPIERLVLFDYQPTRGYVATKTMLKDFEGFIQSDGYAVYEKVAKKSAVTQVACWAHARREFEKALKTDKARAQKALTFIQKLYAIERQAREQKMDAEIRKDFRLKKALPIINTMGKWVVEQYQKVLPKSLIGKAFAYSINRWTELSNYLLDGHLEIDNNLTENAIRPVALGRKNYLFAGSHEAAKQAAIIYTFVANCKKHEVNPYEWLKYALENIMSTSIQELHRLYPQNFNAISQK